MKQAQALEAAKRLQLLNAHRTNVIFHGYSMEPLLTEGDQVMVQLTAFEDIRIGDIIISKKGDKFPACRVLYKRKDSLIVWRDNWAHREIPQVSRKDILGELIVRERKGSKLSKGSFGWMILTLWAFVRLVPGRIIRYSPILRRYTEKHLKQGPVYE